MGDALGHSSPKDDPAKLRPEQVELYTDQVRTLIWHENELRNNRMVWLCLIQGFLFAALGTSIGPVDNMPLIPTVLAMVGLPISMSFRVVFYYGERAIDEQYEKWKRRLKGAGMSPGEYWGADIIGYRDADEGGCPSSFFKDCCTPAHWCRLFTHDLGQVATIDQDGVNWRLTWLPWRMLPRLFAVGWIAVVLVLWLRWLALLI